MPRLDGTGPDGRGKLTGLKQGNCGNPRIGKNSIGVGRPRRLRRVGRMPRCNRFGPVNYETPEVVNMTVEEYESIRLIDQLNLTQEQAAENMNVSRTTVQSIYSQARKKMSDALINNKQLFIDGGDYHLEED